MYSQGQQNINNQFSMQPQMNSGMQGNMPTTSGAIPGVGKKKLPLPWIIVAAEALLIVILAVIILFSGSKSKKVSIAEDKTEDVVLNFSDNVESFAAVCETPDYYISFDKNNAYYIERKVAPTMEEETDDEDEVLYDNDGDIMQVTTVVDLVVEKGNYTVDGYDLHLKPRGDEDYYAAYHSHKLRYEGKEYACKNEE